MEVRQKKKITTATVISFLIALLVVGIAVITFTCCSDNDKFVQQPLKNLNWSLKLNDATFKKTGDGNSPFISIVTSGSSSPYVAYCYDTETSSVQGSLFLNDTNQGSLTVLNTSYPVYYSSEAYSFRLDDTLFRIEE